MSNYDPPTINSNIFNDSYFTSIDGALTIQTADLRYLKLTGGVVRGDTTFSSNLNVTNALTVSTSLSTPIINSNQYLLAGSSILASALTSITPGSASASKALVLDASANITSIGTIGQTVAAGGDMLVLTSTATTARNTIKFVTDNQSWEIGSRGSTAANPTNFYVYNGSYKLLMNPQGDTQILSTTDSSSVSTGALVIKGGLACVKNAYFTGTLTLDRNGSNISITNPGSGSSALIELPASPSILRLVRGYSLNIGLNGICIESASARDPRCAIDLGATTSNKHIALYIGANSFYGLSANNLSMQYSSNNQHNWYSSCSESSPINFNCMNLTASGTLTATQNVIASTGFWAKEGFSSTGRAGRGTAVLCGASYGEVYSYNYSTSQYLPTYIGNVMYVNNSSQSVNIGGGINPGLYPLTVNGSSSTTFSPYGYLSSGGAGSGSSSGVVPVSIWASDRIACSEFNAYSDERLKENIEDIDIDEALSFVYKLKPKSYNWKSDKNNICIGFLAQDVLRLKNKKWDSLVSLSEDSELGEKIDEDGFVHPIGKRFQLAYQNMIPILHKALSHALDVIKAQEVKIQKNGELINDLLLTVKYLKDKISLL